MPDKRIYKPPSRDCAGFTNAVDRIESRPIRQS